MLPENIILLGFMGSGKTTTAKELSKLLDYEYWDMDQFIEKNSGLKISEIFADKGESYFREQEKVALDWVKTKKKFVISTGGGVWLDEINRSLLVKLGLCVWLKVSPEEAWKRVSKNLNQRPLLSCEGDPFDRLKSILESRTPIYSLAKKNVETDNKSPELVAREILELIRNDELGKSTG